MSRNVSVVAARTGIDGGMHPSFYAKLSPTMTAEMDARGQKIIPGAGTPGALPRTTNNPPRETTIPLQPNTEVAAAEDTPSPASVVRVANAGQANAPEAPVEKPTSMNGLFGSLFGGKQEQPAPVAVAEAPAPKKTVASRVKGAVVAAAERTKDAAKAVAGKAKSLIKKDKAEDTAVAANAPQLRPRIDENTKDPAKTAPASAPTQQAAAQPAGEIRTAFSGSSTSGSGGTLSGATPVLPAGSFNARFYGSR